MPIDTRSRMTRGMETTACAAGLCLALGLTVSSSVSAGEAEAKSTPGYVRLPGRTEVPLLELR